MSAENTIRKLDDLIVVLGQISEEVKQIVASLKQTMPPKSVDIKDNFPEELANILSFEFEGDYIVIRPRQFLGSDSFAKVVGIVRGLGGEYVSQGKLSHFRVPKEKA